MRQEDPKILDEMIKNSQELVDKNWDGDPKKKLSLSKLAKNQIRNILDMAQATDSFKALEIFIRYQAGRKTISHKFAEDLIRELEKIQKESGIEEIRLYLGYMYRYFVWKEFIWKESLKGDTNE